MKEEKITDRHEKLVHTYFGYIKQLRSGEDGAVERLVDLWDDDGVFEFAGSPPVNATFVGRNAIHVLYKNRFAANGMPLALGEKGEREAALGVVDTEVHRTRQLENKLVAGWTTLIGTRDREGFQVSGSHTFTFRGDRIASLKVVVSPRAEVAQGERLSLESLAVDDIGRLSLAAWAVV